MDYPVGMLEGLKDQQWEEAQCSMDMRVKMGTDDQRVLGLGRTAEDNRRRGLP